MSSCKGLRFPGIENAAKEPTSALVCVCKLAGVFVYVSVCDLFHSCLKGRFMCRSSNRDKVKENVCGWHLLGEEDARG